MKKLMLLLLVVFLTAVPAFAQKSFDMRYNEAVEYYTGKQFDKAIKVLEAAKKSPGVTKDQISKANRLINQCKAAKQKMSDLNLSKEQIAFPGSGQVDSIYVTAGKSWEVSASPGWCNTWKEADILYIEAMPNEDKAARKGTIEVTMGKERTAYILVSQDKQLDVSCPVHIVTVPERAMVYVDNNQGKLSEDYVLTEGNHRIRIEKNGYERKDTTIVLGRKDAAGASFVFSLEPQFATVSVDIKPAEGYAFDEYPTLDISGNDINLHPSTIKSFNVDQELSYYSIYEGGVIPLHPGQYVLKAEAEGFVAEKKSVTADRGVNQHIEFVLVPICGTISVSDEENAAGAQVFVDDKEVGTVPFEGVVLKSGVHKLRAVKPGYVTDADEYDIEVFEDRNTPFKLSMQKFNEVKITSEPAYCKIYLDGEYVGTTPMDLVVREGEHVLSIEKSGFYAQTRTIRGGADGPDSMHIDLQNAYPLLVTADVDSLGIVISQGNGKDRTVYAENVKTPSTVQIPLSSRPYHIELIKSNRQPAYKGNFTFSDPSRNQVNILTWNDGMAYLAGNWFALAPKSTLGTNPDKYSMMFDASLMRFKVFKGLTTSVAKAKLFWKDKEAQGITYPYATTETHTFSDTVIPAFSVLFINEEFRVGGAVLPFMDVAAVATYAWYPNVSKILAFTHMSGHDIFLGAEVGSRLQIFNANLKAGMQMFFGQANICLPAASASQAVKDRFVAEPYKNVQFVVTLGFTLGGRDSRGQNILRVF